MSQIENPDLILEWSPEEVRAYWPRTGKTRTGESISDAVGSENQGRALILISRKTSFVRTVRLPNVGGRDLQMLVKNSLPGLIPLPPGELAYDLVQTGDITADGRLIVLGAVLNPYLVQINSEADRAGVKIGAVIPAGFSAPIIAEKAGYRSAAVVAEAAGGLNIDFVVGGILRYSRAAIPSADIDSEIARTTAAAGLQVENVVTVGSLDYESGRKASMNGFSAASLIDLKRPPMNIELTAKVEKRLADEIASRRRISLFLLVASLCAAGLVYDWRSDDWSKVNAQTNHWKSEVKKLQDDVDVQTKRIQHITPMNQLVSRGFQPGQSLVDALKTITADAPEGLWISALSLERGKPFTIRGSALSGEAVTKFVIKLGEEQRFRDVKLIATSDAQIMNQKIVQFNIQGFPIGNLPLVDDTKGKSSSAKPAGGA